MATIHSLPAEVLLDIFEYTSEDPYHINLVRFSLVCRQWRQPAQQVLWATVDLHQHTVTAFLASPGLGKYRTRDIAFGDTITIETGLQVLRVCPGAVALDVGWEPDSGGYAWCASEGAQTVHDLVLAYPEKFPPGAEPLRLRLRHLKLFTDGALTNNTITSIFTSSISTLRSLQIVVGWGDNSEATIARLAAFLSRVHLPELHSLVIETSGRFKFAACIIVSLPSISTLAVEHVCQEDVAIVGGSVHPHLADLSFTGDVAELTGQFEELLNMIKLPTLAGLRRLSMPKLRRAALDSPAGRSLLEECESRSIAFSCRYGYLTLDLLAERLSIGVDVSRDVGAGDYH